MEYSLAHVPQLPSPSAAVIEAWAPIAHAVPGKGSHPRAALQAAAKSGPLLAATRENQRKATKTLQPKLD